MCLNKELKMKKYLLIIACLFIYKYNVAQDSITVNVLHPGGFASALVTAGGNATAVTNLIVKGNIDRTDIFFMRDNMPVLSSLDLSGTSMTTLYRSSFLNKYSLVHVKLPVILDSIGDYAFYQCENLHKDSVIIPGSLKAIGMEAFSRCRGFNGDLIIPESVTSLGGFAFNSCTHLNGHLVIPNSIHSISEGAFVNCPHLTGDLTIPNSVVSIGNSAFTDCRGFNGKLTIPNSVTFMDGFAFSYCTGLTGSLNIPPTLTTIYEYTFVSCGFTGSLVLPNSITSIGDGAFSECKGFNELIIPSSVTSIEDEAFSYCVGLKKIIVGLIQPLSIDSSTFAGMNHSECELIVPKGSKVFYVSANVWKKFNPITEKNFVFFNSQGGSVVSDTVADDNSAIIQPNDPTRPDYTFEGWYKEAECIHAWNFANDRITGNTTLYAKWQNNIAEAVNTVTSSPSYKLFPNPVNDFFTLEEEGIDRVTILDPSGTPVMQLNIFENDKTISVTKLKPGIYFMRLENKGRTIKTLSFVKI